MRTRLQYAVVNHMLLVTGDTDQLHLNWWQL